MFNTVVNTVEIWLQAELDRYQAAAVMMTQYHKQSEHR